MRIHVRTYSQDSRFSSFWRFNRHIGLIYLLSVSFMILSLLGANLIPNDPVLHHLRQSLPSKNYSSVFGATKMDQFTECTAATVGISADNSELRLIQRSVLSPVLGNCEESWQYLKTGTGPAFNYWRYWHGSQIIMRPALTIMSVLDVRAVTFFLFVSSFMFCFVSLYRHGLYLCGLAMFSALFCVHLQSALFILPHAMDWVIGFLACGLIVRGLKRHDTLSVNGLRAAFFFIGLLSAFFGLLNNPLVSLTIPLFGVFWSVAFHAKKFPHETCVPILVATCFWLIGYVACWATKWLLASFFVGDVFSQISGVVSSRLGGPSGTAEITWLHSFKSVLHENQKGIFRTPPAVAPDLDFQ